MTAREMSSAIQSAARAALGQLPAAVLAELEIAGIGIHHIAMAIGNNAAMAIAAVEEQADAA